MGDSLILVATIYGAEVDEMSDEPYKQPAGWYYAQGDPPGTQRYWDGNMWQGNAQPVPGGTAYGATPDAAAVPAAAGRRLLARLIDLLVWVAIGVLVAIPTGIAMALSESDGLLQTLGELVAGILIVVYEYVMVTTGSGTVGKRLLGLKVAAVTGTLDSQVALRRVAPLLAYVFLERIPVLGFVLFFALPLAGLVMVFVDKKRQTPWDKLANTVVANG